MEVIPLQCIPQTIKDAVFGYMKQNAYCFHMPHGIINIILFFYYIGGQFNKAAHGSNLKFIDYKTVQKIKDDNDFSTVVFGTTLSTKTSDIVEIRLKIVKASKLFCVGFLTTASIKAAIKNWDHQLGWGDNKMNSVEFYSSQYDGHIHLRDGFNAFRDLGHVGVFHDGTVCQLLFNFKDQYVKVSLFKPNDTNCSGSIQFSLAKYEYVTPGLSLLRKQQIEIIKYKVVSATE